MPVHTVLGPIAAERLGRTSMHEHCVSDASLWQSAPREEPPHDTTVRIENLGFIRWNFDSLADNLRLDDPDTCAREVAPLAERPEAAIVDLTPTFGLGGDPRVLRRISRATGVHIIAGCGFYVHGSHPDWVEERTVDELADGMLSDLHVGLHGTGVTAGIIGEIGTSDPPTAREMRVVTAAGIAGSRSGAAVNVHLDPFGHHGLEIVRTLLDAGMPANRIVLSHLDAYTALDASYQRDLADSGVILEFDNFGLENYTTQTGSLRQNRSDLERMERVAQLLDHGLVEQLVLGSDVYTKAQLRTYGGLGYTHLQKRIVPALQEYFGVTDAHVEQMLVATPRRLLDRP
jgi:phosphotriesterase-related protein